MKEREKERRREKKTDRYPEQYDRSVWQAILREKKKNQREESKKT